MNYLMIVLDGGGDVGKRTPLSLAKKPYMDRLARNGIVGLLDMKYKDRVDSDLGYLKLLGCYSPDDYPGRGYLEALGIGLEPGERDLCIRGNFATLNSRGTLTDRRAGRDETGLAEFCGLLDGMEIDGVRFTVRKSAGHRVVIIAQGENLSARVKPNDPKTTGVPLPQVKPLSPEAKFTTSVLNKFTYRVSKILSKQNINRKRRVPANVILLRSFGMKRETKPFNERYGLKASCISAMPVAKGVARFLGIDVINVKGATGLVNTDLDAKFSAAVESFKDHDFVFLHINGTDIVSHDRKPAEKRRFIEKIDKRIGKFMKRMDMGETVVIVTSDHRTASSPSFRGYEHTKDPVPVLISGDSVPPDRVEKFDEANAENGSFAIENNDLVKFALGRSGML